MIYHDLRRHSNEQDKALFVLKLLLSLKKCQKMTVFLGYYYS